jgi:hypothetical protein
VFFCGQCPLWPKAVYRAPSVARGRTCRFAHRLPPQVRKGCGRGATIYDLIENVPGFPGSARSPGSGSLRFWFLQVLIPVGSCSRFLEPVEPREPGTRT